MSQVVSNINEQAFREVMGHFPTGVVAVTACDGQGQAAMTLQSFQSLSLNPQLVLISVTKTSTSWPTIRRIGSFAITVLSTQQSEIARAFSRPGADKFANVDLEESRMFRHPVPAGGAAVIECRIRDIFDGGDHDIVVAEVHSLELGKSCEHPLVFFASKFSRLETKTPAA